MVVWMVVLVLLPLVEQQDRATGLAGWALPLRAAPEPLAIAVVLVALGLLCSSS